MSDFKIGQKWISNAEPELGMGRVIRLEDRTVSLFFDAAKEERNYARAQAPLTRVRFNPGDQVMTQDGITLTITSVVDRDGIHVYHGDYQGTNTAVVETELDANVRFSKPEDRLFTHQVDENEWFNLRYHSRIHLSRLAQSANRGLYGPRVSPIPHQLYIANEVATRFAPRVLLADEVGLGKTIEAGLIIHQQLQTGRAGRVLVIVPPALTFQWFVEMVRRFNLTFTVMDEARCQQIMADNMPEQDPEFDDLVDPDEAVELDDAEAFNPFEAQQMVLASLDLFTDNTERLEQALDAEWDLVVVDEAHHLTWSPDAASMQYKVVELISRVSKGLLLLTATPEQLGRAGHFARLRLLDPNRFHDFDAFVAEEAQFESVVQAVNQLLTASGEEAASARARIRETLGTETGSDDELISSLLDRHGTGRVLFRNVRSSVPGFPQRVPLPAPLKPPGVYPTDTLYPELYTEGWLDIDPRVDWLIELAKATPKEKFLVICAHQQTAMDLEKALGDRAAIRSTVFHEGLDLIARDRAATYFAETDRGAQVLVCSEIGSEGRNFQFASNLVLFDLPFGPDLLEQRIGRLDRIGQLNDVRIHIPYLEGTLGHAMFRWYDEGVQIFAEPNPVAQSLFETLSSEIGLEAIDELIEKTRIENEARRDELNRGRDRLLELNSHRREVSSAIVEDLRTNEGGEALEQYMELSFDLWGLESEDLGDDTFSVKPTELMTRNASVSIETMGHYHYPELPEDGIQVTYDRDIALAREDVGFFSWENPIVQQALDLAVSDVTGNSAMIAVKHPSLPSGTLLVEAMHVVDCVAPKELGVDRFLPPRVLRSVISPNLTDVAEQLAFTGFSEEALEVRTDAMNKLLDSQRSGIRDMLGAARKRAVAQLDELKVKAAAQAANGYDNEISRLTSLRKVNNTIRPEEVEYLTVVKEMTCASIEQAEVRLDAIRVIVAA